MGLLRLREAGFHAVRFFLRTLCTSALPCFTFIQAFEKSAPAATLRLIISPTDNAHR